MLTGYLNVGRTKKMLAKHWIAGLATICYLDGYNIVSRIPKYYIDTLLLAGYKNINISYYKLSANTKLIAGNQNVSQLPNYWPDSKKRPKYAFQELKCWSDSTRLVEYQNKW